MKLGIFLPGRLGSERLPMKLILPMGSTCLWEIACKKLKTLSEKYPVYELCNEAALIDIAEEVGVPVIVREFGTECIDGPLTQIFKDVQSIEDCTHLMFLNPCLAFLSADNIDKACQEFIASGENYATSVKPYKNWLWSNDKSTALTPVDYERLTTKEIPEHYEAAHCFHIFDKDQFFKDGHMLRQSCLKISVDPEQVIDVDTKSDYDYVSYLWAKRHPETMLASDLVFDLDGTICTDGDPKDDYASAKPIKERIVQVNAFHQRGIRITIDTARGHKHPEKRYDILKITEKQLKDWGVEYDSLRIGAKIPADLYIDDKAISDIDFF